MNFHNELILGLLICITSVSVVKIENISILHYSIKLDVVNKYFTGYY